MFLLKSIEDRLKTIDPTFTHEASEEQQQRLFEIKQILAQLKTQLTNFEILTKDKTFKEQQQIIDEIRENEEQIPYQIKRYQCEIEHLDRQIASKEETTEKVALIEERTKLALTLNSLNVKQSKDKETLKTLLSSRHFKILKSPTVPPLKEIAANFIASHPLYSPTSTALPADVHKLISQAQSLTTIKKYLMGLQIRFISSNILEELKQTIHIYIVSHNNLPPLDAIFFIAIIIGDAASVYKILNCIEKKELQKITDNIDRYCCNELLPIKPGIVLLEDHHPFYTRLLWLFSVNFVQDISDYPLLCLDEDNTCHSYWDRPFFHRCDHHLWEVGIIAFKVFFSVLPKTIPIKKLMLQLACMYGGIDIVKFYCEQDPDKDVLIQYLRTNNLASIAAQYVNTEIIQYFILNKIITTIPIYHSMPKFLSDYCATVANTANATLFEDERLYLIKYCNAVTIAQTVISCQEEQLKQANLLLQQKQQQIDELLKQQTANTPLVLSTDQTNTKRVMKEDITSNSNKKPKTNLTGHEHVIMHGNNMNLLMPSPKQNISNPPPGQLSENALLQISNINKNRG